MKKTIFMLLPGLIITAGIAFFIFRPVREAAYYERHHPYCLTGISTEDPSVLAGEDSFGIANVFIAWPDGFPWEFSRLLPETTLLIITWEPYRGDFDERSILPDIVAGREDAVIAALAAEVKDYGRPCLVRWGHEMNGNWYPWSGAQNNRDAAIYLNAHRRIKRMFDEAGVENARFVFSVNAEDIPPKDWNRFEDYYPGSQYVDFLGISGYNWGNTQRWGRWFWMGSRWRSPRAILERVYHRLLEMDPTKALLLTEVASTSSGGNKEAWLSELFRALKDRYPAIKGFVWFDIDKETDWAITHREDLFNVYRKYTRDEFFKASYLETELFNEQGRITSEDSRGDFSRGKGDADLHPAY